MPILSIDQSYTNTGISLVGDDQHKYSGQALFWTNYLFRSSDPHWRKRAYLAEFLTDILQKHQPKMVVIERVRLHRNGKLSLAAAIALSTLSACIIDTARTYQSHMPIYELDTMDWKRAMLRTPAERHGKQGTMDLITALIGAPIHDDNIADSLAMGYCAYQNPHLLKATTI